MRDITWDRLQDKIQEDEIVVHCVTREDSEELLHNLNREGFTWLSNKNLLEDKGYDIYRERTCYRISDRKWVGLHSLGYLAIKDEPYRYKREV